MVSLYSWQVFVTVAEEKSFVKAARVLNVSQSAVSHIIAKLEEEQGYALFLRNRSNVELTANGRLLMPYVRSFLAAGASLEGQMAGLSQSETGEVKIAGFNSVCAMWLPDIIKRFHEKYPDVRVIVRQTGDLLIRDMINNGEVDLAFLSQGTETKGEFQPLHRTPLLCLTPKDFVPKNGVSVTPEDLREHPLILQYEGYDTEMVLYLKQNGFTISSEYRIEVDATCHSYVEKGLGFCLAARMTLDCNPADVGVWPLVPEWERVIGLVTVFPEYLSPSVRLFREEIFAYFKKKGLMNICSS